MTAIWRIIFHSEAGISGFFGVSAGFALFAGVVTGVATLFAGIFAPSAAVAAKSAKTVCRQNFTAQIIPKSGIIGGA